MKLFIIITTVIKRMSLGVTIKFMARDDWFCVDFAYIIDNVIPTKSVRSLLWGGWR